VHSLYKYDENILMQFIITHCKPFIIKSKEDYFDNNKEGI